MIDPLMMGAAAGVIANEAQRHVDKHVHGDKEPESLVHELKSAIQALHQEIAIVSTHYRKQNEVPLDVMLNLLPDPTRYRVATLGRRHNMVFCPNASPAPQMNCNIPGVGVVTFTLATGWNKLDFPDGTELFLATGSPIQLIMRYSHYTI